MKKLMILLCIALFFTACNNNRADEIPDLNETSEFVDFQMPSGSSGSNELLDNPESGVTAEESFSSDNIQIQKPKPTDSSSKSSSQNTSVLQMSSRDTSSQQGYSSNSSVLAKAADAVAVADKLIEYVNQYRAAEGTTAAVKLPKLTQVAEYRGKQLVTNFAHDKNAEREALRFYEYGVHVVDEAAGLDHYDGYAREAIGRTGRGYYSIEEAAKVMVNWFKNSSGHWLYIGGENYKYIAVGASYSQGEWFFAIFMSKENTFE